MLPNKNRHHNTDPKMAQEQHARRLKWLSQHKEEILEPDLPIIDAHHHLWVRAGNRYYLEDFLAEAQTGHNIKASVFVECGSFYRKNASALMAPIGFQGSVIVVDPKREVSAALADAMGKGKRSGTLFDLSPFNPMTGGKMAVAYNPLDLLDPASDAFVADVMMLAEAMIYGDGSSELF